MDEGAGDAERLAAVAAELAGALPFRRPRRTLGAARAVYVAAGAPRVATTIVVVGTNGKTSTTTLAERMLLADGRRVAAFVSPHLDAWNERLRVDGRPVGAGTLADALTGVGRGARDRPGGEDLRFFDLLTVAAARVARDAGVDVAVFEAGLGGRLDATALLAPDVLAVTRVALDHTELLGATREAVYREKVAAAGAGTRIVVAPSSSDLVATGAHPTGSTVETVPAALLDAARRAHPGAPAGAVENAALAAFALSRLPAAASGAATTSGGDRATGPGGRGATTPTGDGAAGPAVGDAVLALLSAVDLGVPGRWETGRVAGIATLTDAGHNPDAWDRLASALRAGPDRPRVVVFGATRERGLAAIVRALEALPPAQVVLTTPTGRPGADPGAVAAALGGETVVVPETHDAFELALARAGDRDAQLVVYGSVYLAAAFRRWSAARDPSPPRR